MNQDTDPVIEQYDRWPYPPLTGDDLNALAPYLKLYSVLGNFTPRFWPAGKPREDLEIPVNALADEDAWQAMEIISGAMRMHEFHVCRPDRNPDAYRIPWDSETLLSYTPGHCVDLIRIGHSTEGPLWAMGRGNLPPVPLTSLQAALFSTIDGRRTVRECLAAAGVRGADAELIAAASPLVRLLWRTGYGVMCVPFE